MEVMSAFVSKFLVLTSAVLLALPSGWCCTTPSQKAPKAPAQAAHSCCRHHEKPLSPDREPVPKQPVQKCCCEKDLATSQNPETPSLYLPLSIPVVIADAPVADLRGGGDATLVPLPLSSPLHVLQCVWRC